MKKILLFLMPLMLSLVVVAMTFIVMLISKDIFSLGEYTDVRNRNVIYTGFMVAIITVICVWALYKWVHNTKVKQMGLSFNKHAQIITRMMTTILIVGFFFFSLYSNKIGLTEWSSTSKLSYVIQVLLLYLAVAIYEEILFRGYLHKLYKKQGKLIAYLISVPLFVLLHFANGMTVPYFFSLVTATLLLTVIYDLSGSIWPSIIVHMLLNAFLSLTSTGINSGSLISLVKAEDYDIHLDLQTYSAATVNVICLIVVIIYFYGVHHKKRSLSVVN